jgi:hypothetical protein
MLRSGRSSVQLADDFRDDFVWRSPWHGRLTPMESLVVRSSESKKTDGGECGDMELTQVTAQHLKIQSHFEREWDDPPATCPANEDQLERATVPRGCDQDRNYGRRFDIGHDEKRDIAPEHPGRGGGG